MKAHIAILPGDGIGPEVMVQAIKVLEAIGSLFGHGFRLTEGAIGGGAIDRYGDPLPGKTMDLLSDVEAVLLGAIGGPKWDLAEIRPEQGLLALRKCLRTYANIRPVRLFPQLTEASPLKAELLDGVDLIVIRELTGGIYFGEKQEGGTIASDVCTYSVEEIERVTRVACGFAMQRSKKLVSVDKANVLATSRLWRRTVQRIIDTEYPDCEVEHMLVDAAAMHLIRQPSRFDVMVTENMFGDILTDEASILAGSMGMLPSASFGDDGVALYEPIHGSAPDIAGQGIANPYAMILCVAMMLRHSFKLKREAELIEAVVRQCVERGILTPDLNANSGVTTEQVGDAVVELLTKQVGQVANS